MTGFNPLVAAGAILALCSVLVVNPMLTVLAGLALGGIWWGAFDNPLRGIVAALLSVQWLQASVKLWLANILSVPLSTPSTQSITDSTQFVVNAHTQDAIVLALCAVLALSIGATIFLPRIALNAESFKNFSPAQLLVVYAPLLVLSLTADVIELGPIGQFVTAAAALRFAPIALMVGVWFHQRRGGPILCCLIAIELLSGMIGYFSNWKSVIIVFGMTLIALTNRSTWRRTAAPIVLGVIILGVFGTIWTIIKPQYRASLNGGTGQQTQVLDSSQAFSALTTAVGDVDNDQLNDGFVKMLERISYVDYLADVLESVPAQIPHEDGRLWGEALGQFTTPRFLFPDKPMLPSDSVRTMRYTGRLLASGAQGTSISIGYVGESYIDFGVFGALAIPFALGIVYSLLMSSLFYLGRRQEVAMCFALTIPLLWSTQQFEMSNIKLVGAITWAWVDCILFVTLVWPNVKALTGRRHRQLLSDNLPQPRFDQT